MKVQLTKELKKNYPGKHQIDLGKLGKKIFQNLEDVIKGYESFELSEKDYTTRCLFGDWNAAKGTLIYKAFAKTEKQISIKVKLQAAYPFMAMEFEKGYIKIKIELFSHRGSNIDENKKILDDLEAKFYSFKEE